ncbi:hypothetical protein ACFFV7_49470 [Nonomuraea spiralis]|uniref:Uncharacterized protein n=1 Tax=Nonomuraea spiralis TaxID=46182 RepID=A0ABV5IXK6_9ACTN|nr:hypothetical protein [Nonomuraea spiralis]GGT12575.1 hypothetical protein GCM10010176_066680 [Nonomuraea spiralis]
MTTSSNGAITTDGRQPLGEILLFLTGAPGEVEPAYAVGAAHRGQGLAGRAAGFHLTPAAPISRTGARAPLNTWLHRRSS